MSGFTGSAALDVFVGLAFVYFLFSVTASGLNEAVAALFNLRAKSLEEGIRRMLTSDSQGSKTVEALAKNRLVSSLVQKPQKWIKSRSFPSYLPNRAFALALLDTLAPSGDANHDPLGQLRKELDSPTAGGAAAGLPEDVRQLLGRLADEAGDDIAHFRTSVETWFDDTMNRVSGWYKRRATAILLVISIGVSGAFNLDSWQIANTLWTNDALRSAVVTQAEQATKTGDAAKAADAASGQLKLPIGWKAAHTKAGDVSDPRALPTKPGAIFSKVLGLLVTALALTLGAPFWFDLLNRLVRLRGTGRVEGSTGAKPAT